MFTKSLLTPGRNVIECRNGKRFFFAGEDSLLGWDGFYSYHSFYEDFTPSRNVKEGYEIFRVYWVYPTTIKSILEHLRPETYLGDPIIEIPLKKKLTEQEVSELLGYDVEIVKSK